MEPAAVLAVALVLASLVANVVCLFRFGWRKPSAARTLAMKGGLALVATLVCLLLLELVFSQIFITSDNFSFTLHSKRWFKKHWKPTNHLKYRDDEYHHMEGKKLLFVIGDSFVAGHGIEDYRDRFSNVLGERMGSDWRVLNVAKNGWNTAEEYAALVTHPYRPDAIVLSYFLNDIEDAAKAHGLRRPELISEPPKLFNEIVEHSYLINFLYWRLVRRANSTAMIGNYGKFRDTLFADGPTWDTHRRELDLFVDYARERQVPLVVVIFPDLFDVEHTTPLCDRVAAHFAERGIPVLNLAKEFAGRSPEDLVVGTFDGHPNPVTHKEVGDLLHQRFFSQGLPAPMAAEASP
jgi:hypothetical protein